MHIHFYTLYTFLSSLHCEVDHYISNEVSSHEDYHDLGYPQINEDFVPLVLLFVWIKCVNSSNIFSIWNSQDIQIFNCN